MKFSARYQELYELIHPEKIDQLCAALRTQPLTQMAEEERALLLYVAYSFCRQREIKENKYEPSRKMLQALLNAGCQWNDRHFEYGYGEGGWSLINEVIYNTRHIEFGKLMWPLLRDSGARMDMPVKPYENVAAIPLYEFISLHQPWNPQQTICEEAARQATRQGVTPPQITGVMLHACDLHWRRNKGFDLSAVVKGWFKAGMDLPGLRSELKGHVLPTRSELDRILAECERDARDAYHNLVDFNMPLTMHNGQSLRMICGAGWLPQFYADLRKAKRASELFPALEAEIPPYYADKYPRLMTVLRRQQPVETSQLADYARGM